MVAIKHNRPCPLRVDYVGGKENTIQLAPGITLGVNPKEWAAIARHPVVADYLKSGVLEVIADPNPTTLEIEDRNADLHVEFQVVDDPITDQPMPVTGLGDRPEVGKIDRAIATVAKVSPALILINNAQSEAELEPLPTIGKASAKQLIANRPQHGYASLDAVAAANESLTRADWDAIANWEG